MSARSLLAGAAACGLLSASSVGCYWSSPPSTPHRNERVRVGELPPLSAPSPRPLAPKRLVVLGRFDTTAPQPIGGLYDQRDYSVSPLLRTYFYKDCAVELFEHVSDGLRAAGLSVLKDYAGHAEPALIEAPLRARDPLLVTATVVALQHDQIREKLDGDAADWSAARLQLAVRVTDTRGTIRLDKSYLVAGRVPYDEKVDVLKLLGWTMAQRLSEDADFVAAVEGGAS